MLLTFTCEHLAWISINSIKQTKSAAVSGDKGRQGREGSKDQMWTAIKRRNSIKRSNGIESEGGVFCMCVTVSSLTSVRDDADGAIPAAACVHHVRPLRLGAHFKVHL